MDGRYREYAKLILKHSLRVQPGERVLIQTEPISARFAEVLGQEVIRAKAHPIFWFTSAQVGSVRLAEGTDEQLQFISSCDQALVHSDCRVCINAPSGQRLAQYSPEAAIRRRRIMGKVYERMEHQRWVVALLPTHYLAGRMNVSFRQCEDMVFRSTIGTDWWEIARQATAIKECFDGGSTVRVVSEGTDLTFSIAGRSGMICTGRRNLPDGECFYSPVHESVEGVLAFKDPQHSSYGWVKGLRLVFKNGRVVQTTADEGMKHLETILNMDAGARYLGEFGIGVNAMLSRITGNILMDEKIAGTVHFALGNAYPESGGTNKSKVHWDMILDLRRGGQIWLNDRLVCQDGLWETESAEAVAVGW